MTRRAPAVVVYFCIVILIILKTQGNEEPVWKGQWAKADLLESRPKTLEDSEKVGERIIRTSAECGEKTMSFTLPTFT